MGPPVVSSRVGKKRQSKSGQKKKREKRYSGPKTLGEESGKGGGVMQNMVSGMQKAAGVHNTQKGAGKGLLNTFLTVLVVGVAAYLFVQYAGC